MKSQRLRIAQVSPLWTRVPPVNYGGIELLLKLLTDELVDQGHDVTLFASADCDVKGRLHSVLPVCLSDMMGEQRAQCYEHYACAVMADAMARAHEFDILHFHLQPTWLPFAANSPCPSLFTLHTFPLHDDEWVMARYPNVEVSGISHYQLAQASQRLGRKFPVIYNGCDFGAFEPRYEKGEYLAFLGRMSFQKNPGGAIQIAKACGMPIVLAGEPFTVQEEAYFNEHVRPFLNDKDVRWIGSANHQQKAELLRNAAALIFPIQWDEPFGLVMIEAMACGTPVVGVRRGSVAEVIDAGITGFSADTVEELAPLVEQAVKLDRRAVRAHGESRFGFRQMVDGYVSLYRELLERRTHAVQS
jgi:glycosyltransferase involved in cell wall biosynthesis